MAAKWRQHSAVAAPSAREAHCSWAHNGKLYVFSGTAAPSAPFEPGTPTNTLHVYDVTSATWEAPATTGAAPPARSSACAAVVGHVALVFGGIEDTDAMWSNSLYSLDLEEMAWARVEAAGAPSARDKASCCALPGDRLLVYGGFGPSDDGLNAGVAGEVSFTWRSDAHVYDLAANTWTRVSFGPGPAPPGRCAAGMCALADGSAFVFGGRAETGGRVNDAWRLEVSGSDGTWTQLEAEPAPQGSSVSAHLAPAARSFHTVVSAGGSRVVVFGGLSSRATHFGDVRTGEVRDGRCAWSTPDIAALPAPTPRGFHSAAVCDGEMWVFGGGGQYDEAAGASTVFYNDLHSLPLGNLFPESK
eukprot:m51a1_g11036 hypothetical protein (359) ;mRNA; f:430079-431222